MAEDEKDSTKVEDTEKSEKNEQEVAEESLLSLDSLNEILAQEDPDFANSLNEIGPDDPAGDEIYDEGLELAYTLEDERKLWSEGSERKKNLLKFLPFLPRFTYKAKMLGTHWRLQKAKLRTQARNLLRNGGPDFLEWCRGLIRKTRLGLQGMLQTFRDLSGARKLLVMVFVLATGGSLSLIYHMATKGILSGGEPLFITSMEDWAQKVYTYDPAHDTEDFYDSMRASQSILLLEKMVVNLRRSANSGTTPMAAFEFYVEGAASEVVVEIKDRESEIRDLFQRTIEEMNFDQVSSGEGKRLMTEKLRKAVNQVLVRGKVRRVFIKTAIVKP